MKDKKVIFNNLKDYEINEEGIVLKPHQALLVTINNMGEV